MVSGSFSNRNPALRIAKVVRGLMVDDTSRWSKNIIADTKRHPMVTPMSISLMRLTIVPRSGHILLFGTRQADHLLEDGPREEDGIVLLGSRSDSSSGGGDGSRMRTGRPWRRPCHGGASTSSSGKALFFSLALDCSLYSFTKLSLQIARHRNLIIFDLCDIKKRKIS